MNASANANDFFSASKAKVEELINGKKRMTGWGAFWRISGLALLFIAAIAAITLGLHFGAAYLVGLGLGETTTLVLSVLLSVVGYLAVFASSWIITSKVENVLHARKATKAFDAAVAA